MSLARSIAVIAIVGGGVSARSAPRYPLADVYAEFVAACGDLKDMDKANDVLLKNGWSRSLPIPTTAIGRLVDFQQRHGRGLIQAEGAEPSKPYVYRKVAHGRTLDLMLQSAALEGGSVNGCRLWDFDVDEPPSVQALTRLAKGNPSVGKEDDLLRIHWPSTEGPGMQGLQIVYVPRDHPYSKQLGVSGLNFKLAYIGIEQE